MPFEDFIVADADMHVMEPADLWQRYIADEYRHAAPIGMTELKRDIRLKVKSQVLLRAGPVSPLKERGGAGIGWREDQEQAYGEAEVLLRNLLEDEQETRDLLRAERAAAAARDRSRSKGAATGGS